MPRGVQITIVTSLRGRCRFVEYLKGITLNIFIENERMCFYICIVVKQQYICIFPEKFICFILRMRVSDIQSTQVPREQRQKHTM